MYRFLMTTAVLTSMSFLVALSGCGGSSGSQSGSSEPAEASGGAPTASDSHAGHDHAEHSEPGSHDQPAGAAMQEMQKGLAGLSEADRQSAMKQHVCPVSGEMLGTMGAPIKVSVKGRDVWLCCPGCQKELDANPDKYLAKVNP